MNENIIKTSALVHCKFRNDNVCRWRSIQTRVTPYCRTQPRYNTSTSQHENSNEQVCQVPTQIAVCENARVRASRQAVQVNEAETANEIQPELGI